MKRIAVVAALALLVVVGLLAFAYSALKASFVADPPLAGYGEVSQEDADALGRKVAEGFSARDAKAFDAALDLDAFGRIMTAEFPMARRQRIRFFEGFKEGLAKAGAGSFGKYFTQSFPADTTVRHLRARMRDGHREAVLRVRQGQGVNYFGLILARDPSGRTRIVDWYNYFAGELGHATMRSVIEATAGDIKQTPFERLLVRFAGRLRKPDATKESNAGDEIAKVRKLTLAKQYDEALKALKGLPEPILNTRSGWMMRLQIAQAMGDVEYQRALDEMSARFPGDPTLALVQVDRHFMKKDFKKALECIDAVDKAVGGDPYLAVLRVQALLELDRAPEAKVGLAEAAKEEPDLIDLQWAAITVSLRQRDHGETMRQLLEIERTFAMEMSDLLDIPDYADFVRSPEYRVWLSRRGTADSE
ncbi:MAG: hypothetical protein HY901_12360 [Deltaproteobacteria bacterium]|nr:hypothetical protein [Deltaproteobacteria bacterium]